MKKVHYIGFVILMSILWISCEKDSKSGNEYQKYFVAAFAEESASYSQISDDYKIEILYSEIALADGTLTVKINERNAKEGIDYTTIPEIVNQEIKLPIIKGSKGTEILFKNLIYPFDRDDKTVQFEITSIDYLDFSSIQGYSVMMVSFDASLGGVIAPNIGGAREQNQVYVELSSKNTTEIQRDDWDLAFYSGDDNRVKLNGSIYMAVAELNFTNIDLVEKSDVSNLEKDVAIGTFDPINVKYIDHPSGELAQTAIAEVSENDVENKVYLVNLGFDIPVEEPFVGSVNVSGKSRGWKKIRVLKRDNDYLLQYADVNASTHKEVLITKNNAYNFQFFSFNTEEVLKIEPAKSKWDLNFTVFTNINDAGSYGYSDFISNNRYGGVKAYLIDSNQNKNKSYDQFGIKDINESLFEFDLRTIGSSWREVADGKKLFNNVYYVIKDAKGNYYKMRMLTFLNEKGERGYPKFEYKLIK
ncbi:HmuY family protein [Myroides guanonis]|uniref:HmuY protein n=1 Tax=Myroides guanonis TaxID=1150112 RepID=A0A1I3M217_9FLAO|nr:HmuY family protein [Myroides guanonis]SFI90840.1 HmuY protein [Myroides guanonis]